MKLIKKYSHSLFIATIVIMGTISFGVKNVNAVSATCSYTHKQTCCGDGTKTLATGSVTINHNFSVVGGLKSNYNIGDTIRFNYSWDGTFSASGGAWDTPTILKCATSSSCFANFVGNTRANTYTQKITDSTGKTGYIQWQADEGGVSQPRYTSSDNNVVRCNGNTCTFVGPGTATITATTSTVWVRLFSKIFSDVSPSGWYASLAPEGFIDVPGRGYITGNSTLTNGCVIRNTKGHYTDPPVSSTGNYKGIMLPAKTQSVRVVVKAPLAPSCTISWSPSTLTAGQRSTMSIMTNNTTDTKVICTGAPYSENYGWRGLAINGSWSHTLNNTGTTNCTVTVKNSAGDTGTCEASVTVTNSSTPAEAACGSASGQTFSSFPTNNLCADGSQKSGSSSSSTSEFIWHCKNGDDIVECRANRTARESACGSAHGSSSTSCPTSGWCVDGATKTNESQTYDRCTWECRRSDGSSSRCSSIKTHNYQEPGRCDLTSTRPACGPAVNDPTLWLDRNSIDQKSLCKIGSSENEMVWNGLYSWKCTNNYGDVNCRELVSKPYACGKADGKIFSSTPSDLCYKSELRWIDQDANDGTWNWECLYDADVSASYNFQNLNLYRISGMPIFDDDKNRIGAFYDKNYYKVSDIPGCLYGDNNCYNYNKKIASSEEENDLRSGAYDYVLGALGNAGNDENVVRKLNSGSQAFARVPLFDAVKPPFEICNFLGFRCRPDEYDLCKKDGEPPTGNLLPRTIYRCHLLDSEFLMCPENRLSVVCVYDKYCGSDGQSVYDGRKNETKYCVSKDRKNKVSCSAIKSPTGSLCGNYEGGYISENDLIHNQDYTGKIINDDDHNFCIFKQDYIVPLQQNGVYTWSCLGPNNTSETCHALSEEECGCQPSPTYTCIENNSVDCSNPDNCGKINTINRRCLVNDGCSSSESQPASVCATNGTPCQASEPAVSCPACPNESNWIEVLP